MVLDAGAGGLLPTTVIDLTGPYPELIREGAGPWQDFVARSNAARSLRPAGDEPPRRQGRQERGVGFCGELNPLGGLGALAVFSSHRPPRVALSCSEWSGSLGT